MSAAARRERALRAQSWAATLSAASRAAVVRGLREHHLPTRRNLLRRATELQADAAREYDYARRLMGIT